LGPVNKTDLSSLVNNAGIAPEASNPRPVWDTPADVFDQTWRVNVRGVFLGCKYGGAQMRKQERIPEYQRAGTILNLGSILGILGKSGTPAYAAAKGAVIAMTRAVAMDYAPFGIHCNSILPGCKSHRLFSAPIHALRPRCADSLPQLRARP
jgi:NAD(P)-dependent dehydrogenase (short-subunit alcohol dehydrogenase family)